VIHVAVDDDDDDVQCLTDELEQQAPRSALLLVQRRSVASDAAAASSSSLSSSSSVAAASSTTADTVSAELAAAASAAPFGIDSTVQEAAVASAMHLGDLKLMGLGGATPVGFLQNSLEYLVVTFDMPWWAAISVTTVCIRILVLPLIIKSMRNSAKMQAIQGDMQRITAQMKQYLSVNNQISASLEQQKLQKLFKDNDVNPFRAFLVPLVQAPIFISFFMALRKMAELPVETFKTGGMLWFQDLTQVDPYYLLPTISCVGMLINIELGSDGTNPSNQTRMVRNVLRGMILLSIPFTAQMPAAVFMYWLTANMFSMSQLAFLKINWLRQKLGIPKVEKKPDSATAGGASDAPAGPGFLDSFRERRNELQREREYKALYEKQMNAVVLKSKPTPGAGAKKL
jgi:YidC/Oxa1 family membrane protein insertase